MTTPMKMAGLFAGIGGIERGFHDALGSRVETVLLCESWDAAQTVLSARFPGVPIHPDVRELRSLPADLDVLAAGFPCTDLSQAGRTAGIGGSQSGLVEHVFEALRVTAASKGRTPWLLIENVPNMLVLDGGRAMAYLVEELERLGFRWAYRVVDSRFTGVPQRRRRVILVASATEDPRAVLFGQDVGVPDLAGLDETIFGFYWTEGRGALGGRKTRSPPSKVAQRSASRRRQQYGIGPLSPAGDSSSRRWMMPKPCRLSHVGGRQLTDCQVDPRATAGSSSAMR